MVASRLDGVGHIVPSGGADWAFPAWLWVVALLRAAVGLAVADRLVAS
jgi:hypothetical protein